MNKSQPIGTMSSWKKRGKWEEREEEEKATKGGRIEFIGSNAE
jgi:hypothetical protein